MKRAQPHVLIAAFCCLALLSTAASAHGPRRHHHHHHHHRAHVGLGIVIGAPLWYPAPAYPVYRPYPYYVAPAPAPVYIEREDLATGPRESGPYWYYCRESDLYYPYVKQCPGPWERVPAQPLR